MSQVQKKFLPSGVGVAGLVILLAQYFATPIITLLSTFILPKIVAPIFAIALAVIGAVLTVLGRLFDIEVIYLMAIWTLPSIVLSILIPLTMDFRTACLVYGIYLIVSGLLFPSERGSSRRLLRP